MTRFKIISDRIQVEGTRVLDGILEKIIGPALRNWRRWNGTAFKIEDRNRVLKRLGFVTDHLFSVDIMPNFKNTSSFVISVSQGLA